MKLGLQVMALFAIVVTAGLTLGDAFLSQTPPASDTTHSDSRSGGLEVRPAGGEGPEPLDFMLQGSSPEEQKAAGNLQNPQTAEDLQPNAKTDLFQDDS